MDIKNNTPANDNATVPAFRPRSIKDLLCDQCGTEEALTDGLCGTCIGDAETLIQERRTEWKGERF